MTTHGLVHQEARQPAPRRKTPNGLLKLGMPQFWLLGVMLGGMLGLVALVFFVAIVSR